ncbi:M20/M25/M40 family metallo-hydrolase [Leeuwenhoekiella sp. A2]|uniref:M20/M25/M40 family metallo-hydrolase n=1 Tax=Leeuwenhoekiella sp. A2 TaxID=3141460 RepID=UPI003A806CB5
MRKRYSVALSFLLLVGIICYSFYTHKPHSYSHGDVPETAFSAERALEQLKYISAQQHSVGTPGHQKVQDYLVSVLEGMGLEVQLEEGFSYKAGWGALSKAVNIITRIPGTDGNKSLLLMSHYDSAPHTASYGASDAGSGVVTVLEAVRAYLATGQKPKNDIIILFTDAEELGLNGASVFTNKHPWAKNVGLALNFEARGSGGPSNMIVETNGGNSALIKAFAKANPEYPFANSLYYSIYKILPNDTDSTVLRKDGDIDSFFFAFIGDHFDYHTALDTYERLDRTSLEHQASYLVPLLNYFSNADLNLKSTEDYVYLNMPVVKMVYYPFSLIWPMLIVAILAFFALIFYGIKKKKFTFKTIGRGFLPFLLSLITGCLVTFFGWKLILLAYPAYADILQGFTYNGYEYIAAFSSLTLAITFFFYHKFYKPYHAASLSIAPLFFWLIISTLVALNLPGASFFIIPVYFGILAVFLIISTRKPNLLALCLLCAPAIFILAHDIRDFPVGLGLKMLTASAAFAVLLFGLLLPLLGFYHNKGKFAFLFLIISIIFFVSAHFKSDFTPERKFPTSINYVYDVDTKETYWATYNKQPDEWISTIMGNNAEATDPENNEASGKYNSFFTRTSPAPRKPVAPSSIYTSRDTVINGMREINFAIYPQREINDMLLSNAAGTPFQHLEFNGQLVQKDDNEPYIMSGRTSSRFLSYRVTDREPLQIKLTVPDTTDLSFTVYDFSYDLLDNADYNLPPRPENTMPMPFIYTDAIITRQEVNFASSKR